MAAIEVNASNPVEGITDEIVNEDAGIFSPYGTIWDSVYSDPNKVAQLPGEIARAQWADYQQRFQPYEDELFNKTHYMRPEMVNEEIARATPQVEGAIDLGRGMQQRRLQALGQGVSSGAQAKMDKGWNRKKSKATVDAANRIRQNIAARSRDIAFGGAQAGRAPITEPYGQT